MGNSIHERVCREVFDVDPDSTTAHSIGRAYSSFLDSMQSLSSIVWQDVSEGQGDLNLITGLRESGGEPPAEVRAALQTDIFASMSAEQFLADCLALLEAASVEWESIPAAVTSALDIADDVCDCVYGMNLADCARYAAETGTEPTPV